MEDKNNSIFRKQTLERISSPEELDSYLTVTGPGVWFTLLAVVVLLIGVFAWMIFGRLNTTLDVAVVSNANGVICYVPFEKTEAALKGERVKIAGAEYELKDAGFAPLLVDGSADVNVLNAGSLAEGDTVKPLRVDAALAEGIYSGEIVVETINPIKFIIN